MYVWLHENNNQFPGQLGLLRGLGRQFREGAENGDSEGKDGESEDGEDTKDMRHGSNEVCGLSFSSSLSSSSLLFPALVSFRYEVDEVGLSMEAEEDTGIVNARSTTRTVKMMGN